MLRAPRLLVQESALCTLVWAITSPGDLVIAAALSSGFPV